MPPRETQSRTGSFSFKVWFPQHELKRILRLYDTIIEDRWCGWGFRGSIPYLLVEQISKTKVLPYTSLTRVESLDYPKFVKTSLSGDFERCFSFSFFLQSSKPLRSVWVGCGWLLRLHEVKTWLKWILLFWLKLSVYQLILKYICFLIVIFFPK